MKILLVEDEIELSKALSLILKKNNYAVDQAFDGEEALSFLSESEYDLLILDIMIPKINGLDVLKEARRKGINTPVLILSAKSEVSDRIEGLDCGADDYLPKPFNIDELLARIRALVRRRSQEFVSLLSFGNISLDRKSAILKTDYRSVFLPNKEMQIMELFLLKPEKIITSEEIINNVWSFDSYSINNNLWVFLSYLRKKLIYIKADVMIKNYRNQGYSLEKQDEKN